MDFQQAYKEKLNCQNADEVFAYLIDTLKDTITKWDYFVNWTKASGNLRKLEISLNLLNYLIGKDDIGKEALALFEEHPQLIETIPALIACRDNSFKMLKDYQNGSFIYEEYSFKPKANTTPEKAVEFLNKSGFLEQLKCKRITSLVDYVFGVEVGLDSNGRKNRGGTAMEDIVEFFVSKLCNEKDYEYMTQATSPKIKQKWGKHVTVDKSKRKIDFAINTPNKLVLIETNFYSGGGSKLKSTAGEYRTLYRHIQQDGHQFIWITDGAGWKGTQLPLRETFNEIEAIINLGMIEKDILNLLIS